MTDTPSPARIDQLKDAELLTLYLSLHPAQRDKTFINTAQAAKITGVSMRTIQLWIESGAVRAIIIGRKYRIVLESLRKHLENQMNKGIDSGKDPRSSRAIHAAGAVDEIRARR